MGRYLTTKYSLDVPDLQEPPNVPADLRSLADQLDDLLDAVYAGRKVLIGTGAPAAGLGNTGDVYVELP